MLQTIRNLQMGYLLSIFILLLVTDAAADTAVIKYRSSLTEFSGISCHEIQLDNDYIYGSYQSGDLNIWKKTDFSLVTSLPTIDSGIFSSCSDQKYIYGATLYRDLYIWNRADFTLEAILAGDRSPLCGVATDSGKIFGVYRSGSIYVWKKADFSLQTRISKSPIGDFDSVFLDSSRLYVSSNDAGVYIWNKDSFAFQTALTEGRAYPKICMRDVFTDDKYIYAAQDSGPNFQGVPRFGHVWIWEKSSFSFQTVLCDSKRNMRKVFRHGDYLYSSSRDDFVHIWRVGDFKYLGKFQHDHPSGYRGLYVDSRYIYSARDEGIIDIWQTPPPQKFSPVTIK